MGVEAGGPATDATRRTEPENVIIIHWHDLGRHLACYGADGVSSPHLDALAVEGIRFGNAHATAPLCSPARGSLFTGQYPHRNGLVGLAHHGFGYRSRSRPSSPRTDMSPMPSSSARDAQAYCRWAGRALPTEAQWEYAARGGLDGARFPWGDEPPTPAEPRCQIFRGEFPDAPSAPVGTVPVRTFEPDGYGLYQTVGNVWEWCADRYSARTHGARAGRGETVDDPRGPDRGRSRVLRGGSYLCHDSYCRRYRVAARSHNTPTSSAGNIGFRTVARRI